MSRRNRRRMEVADNQACAIFGYARELAISARDRPKVAKHQAAPYDIESKGWKGNAPNIAGYNVNSVPLKIPGRASGDHLGAWFEADRACGPSSEQTAPRPTAGVEQTPTLKRWSHWSHQLVLEETDCGFVRVCRRPDAIAFADFESPHQSRIPGRAGKEMGSTRHPRVTVMSVPASDFRVQTMLPWMTRKYAWAFTLNHGAQRRNEPAVRRRRTMLERGFRCA